MDVKCPRCQQVMTARNLEAIKTKARRHRCKKKQLANVRPATAKDPGLVAVPIGPFGLFGTRWVTARKFQKEQKARERREIRQKRQRQARLKRRLKKTARSAFTGKKMNRGKKGKSLGFGLYW